MLFVFGIITSGSDAWAGTAIESIIAFWSVRTSISKNSRKHGKYTWLIQSFMWASVTAVEPTLMSKSRNGMSITGRPANQDELDGEADPELNGLDDDDDELKVVEATKFGLDEALGSKQKAGKLHDAGFKKAVWKPGKQLSIGEALRAW
jgi:hypothetical protein